MKGFYIAQRMIPLWMGVFVLVVDVTSKLLTHLYLPVMHANWLWYPYGGIGVFKNFLGIEFSISYQINRGAAWGLLADFQLPLLYVRLALILFLILYTFYFNKRPNWIWPLTLIIAGALGNVLDYFLYGFVVDMLHFVLWGYDFPVFNLADTSIFIGISWLLAASSLEKNKSSKSYG